MQKTQTDANKLESDAIAVCRLVCIFFMIFVHVNPGLDNFKDYMPGYLGVLKFVMADLLGRASVPALSVIGGYLAAGAIARRPGWLIYIKDRISTLLLPMATWNVLSVALVIVIYVVLGLSTSMMKELALVDKFSVRKIADLAVGTEYGSAVMAFNFLRDIFICSMVLPVIIVFLKFTRWYGVAIIWALGVTVGFAPVIYRPHILMFFAFGCHLSLAHGKLNPGTRTILHGLAIVLTPLVIISILSGFQSTFSKSVESTVFRLIVSVAFIAISFHMARTTLGKRLASSDRLAFPLFLSHPSIILILWGIWQMVFGKTLDWPYVVFYLGAPLASVAIVWTSYPLIVRLPANLQRLLLGKVQGRKATVIPI